MALTDALYGPIESFQQAAPRTFAKVVATPPFEFDANADVVGRIIASSDDRSKLAAALDRFDRTEAKLGAWPSLFISSPASDSAESTEQAAFSPLAADAFEDCFGGWGRRMGSGAVTSMVPGFEDLDFEEPRGVRDDGDPDAVDVSSIVGEFDDF